MSPEERAQKLVRWFTSCDFSSTEARDRSLETMLTGAFAAAEKSAYERLAMKVRINATQILALADQPSP